MSRRLEDVRLEGERVHLRPISVSDARPAHDFLVGREEVLRWLVWQGPRSVAELEERFGRWRMDDEDPDGASDYQFAIVAPEASGSTGSPSSSRSENAPFVGGISIRFRGHAGQGDLGYWIAQEHWGCGYAKEAVRLSTWLAFRHLEASVVYGWVFVGNEASRRVLEVNGFRLEHTARDKVERDGRVLDEWYLAQTRWDWDSREAAFAPRSALVVPQGSDGSDGSGGPRDCPR